MYKLYPISTSEHEVLLIAFAFLMLQCIHSIHTYLPQSPTHIALLHISYLLSCGSPRRISRHRNTHTHTNSDGDDDKYDDQETPPLQFPSSPRMLITLVQLCVGVIDILHGLLGVLFCSLDYWLLRFYDLRHVVEELSEFGKCAFDAL
jgi:hypothetical protein